MKIETLKSQLSLATVWLQDPDSSSLAQCSKEAIKSFTIRFIISVFTIKRAVIVLGLFYFCLFILFHCPYKSHSHFALLGFSPFQLLVDERGRKTRLANKLDMERVWSSCTTISLTGCLRVLSWSWESKVRSACWDIGGESRGEVF